MNLAEAIVSLLLEDFDDAPFDLRWSHNGHYADVIVRGQTIGTLMCDPHTERWSYAKLGVRVDPGLARMNFRQPEQGARLLWKAWSDQQQPERPEMRMAA